MTRTRPARRIALALLTALLLAPLLTFLSVPSASAAGDVSWALRTASNKYGASRQNYSYALNPGGTIKDGLVVANHGSAPITLGVYAADGFTTGSGQLDLLRKDQRSKGVGLWVHPAKNRVTVQPGKSVTIPFQLRLPTNATPGDHLGGIITSLTQEGAANGLNVDRRLAMRIRLRVGGELAPRLTVENLQVAYAGTLNPLGRGDATVRYTIRNTGNAILSAHQKVSVAGPFGLLRHSAGSVADTPELLPGEQWQVSVPVRDIVPTLRIGARVQLTPALTDAAGSVSLLKVTTTDGHGWALPWTLILLVAIVVAVVVLLRRRSRQDRDRAKTHEDARVARAVAEALRDRETADH